MPKPVRAGGRKGKLERRGHKEAFFVKTVKGEEVEYYFYKSGVNARGRHAVIKFGPNRRKGKKAE